ncbi:uncharacterized protein [Diadema antillarum]|uniref:uncharacterized protein n=1 Tax=Diadema antillarum TaxID=105358 RepID=UPI003A852C27
MSTYTSALNKVIQILRENGPQPVGILLDMIQRQRTLVAAEKRVIGTNKREFTNFVIKEPNTFRFLSPPGLVMLCDARQETNNQVTQALNLMERYLRTKGLCSAQELLTQVVRHQSVSTGCIAGKKTLRKLLSSHPDRFQIYGSSMISLTKSRLRALNENLHTGGGHYKHSETSVSPSSGVTISDLTTRHGHSSTNLGSSGRSVGGGEGSPSSLVTGLRFVQRLIQRKGPMLIQDAHLLFMANPRVSDMQRRAVGRTPEAMLVHILQRRCTYHVIPPLNLITLAHTKQVKCNQLTTALRKIKSRLKDCHPGESLLDLMQTVPLTASERRSLGINNRALRLTVKHYRSIFSNVDVDCLTVTKKPRNKREKHKHGRERR